MRPLRVASALLLRSSHAYGRCSQASFPASFASLPHRLLSSGRPRSRGAGQQHSLVTRTRCDPACADLMRTLQLQLPSLRGKDVSNIWLGARDLRVSESRAPSDVQFMQELCKVTKEQVTSFEAQAIANTLNCIANLNYDPGKEVLRRLCAEALKKADSFNAQGIANTLNALKKLGHNPGEELLRRLCSEAFVLYAENWQHFERVGEPRPQPGRDIAEKADIANTLNALANLDHNPGEELLRRLCAEALKKVESFNAQNIANTLNALANLDHNPGEILLGRLCAEALKKAESFNLQDISNTLNALVKLDHNPGEQVLRRLCAEALKKAESFTAQKIANTLNALAKLDHNPGQELLRRLCAEALKKAESFNAQEIANTLNALANLDHNPGEILLGRLCAEALKKAESFNSQGIANTLNALVKLDHNPGEQVLRRLCAEALKKAESFTAQGIANTLYACIVLNRVDPSLFSRLISRLPEKLDPKELNQLHYVQLSLRSEHSSLGLSLPAPLPAACKSSMMQETVHSSELHKEVSKVLRKENVPHVNEDTSSGLWVDIGMAEHRVVIEVDGPTHFVAGSVESKRPKYNLTTLYKHRLLRAMGWRVVSVPFYEWQDRRPEERALNLRQKLREVDDCQERVVSQLQPQPPHHVMLHNDVVSGRKVTLDVGSHADDAHL
eukprot:g50910.t1